MRWRVGFHSEFKQEFDKLPKAVRLKLVAKMKILEEFGPSLGRPNVDTLSGSGHADMKEIRFNSDGGVW